MAGVNTNTLCPVCGFDLDFEPWRGESPSDELCPCCGIQFGYHDVPEGAGLEGTKEEVYAQWRADWIARGMEWDHGWSAPPPGWDPVRQLRRIGVDRG